MANLKLLLYARLFSLFMSFAFTIAIVGLSGKALTELQHYRNMLKKPPYSALFPKAYIDADDVLGAVGTMCAAAGLGVIFTNISEFLLFKEARAHYLPKACRYMNEAIMGFASLFMLAGTITATVIVMNHSANIYSNGKLVPTATIAPAAKALGLSLAYKDFTCYYAMVLSWIAWFFLTLSTVLICIAGLHYRKQRREGRHPSQQSGLAGVEKNGANHHTEHSR